MTWETPLTLTLSPPMGGEGTPALPPRSDGGDHERSPSPPAPRGEGRGEGGEPERKP